MLDYVIQTTKAYLSQNLKEDRKSSGQFFTSEETARFMAEQFDFPIELDNISVLDPGAGTGILSAAVIERLQTCSNLEKITLTCYETDARVIDLLRSNLNWICEHSRIRIEYILIEDNYILNQAAEYQQTNGLGGNTARYDIIIGNPPYKKISKHSPEACLMSDVCYGAPNLYFLFASMSLFNLREHGQMVYVIPRSWTSGLYFKKFREKMLLQSTLERIHLFISRTKVFDNENVLQETMIIKLCKTAVKPSCITVTTSQSNQDFNHRTSMQVPYHTIVSDCDSYVYLVTSERDTLILNRLRKWNQTLPEIGLKMKTGLTVDFRSKESLRRHEETMTVPLFYSSHIRNGKICFPVGQEWEYILTDRPSLLQPNTNYLFLKRFTAKEEARRLQCGIYLARRFPQYSKISTQNKINFIDSVHALSECAVYGLYVLFNSSLYDSYYRIMDGSTQVNSTEINAMPVPAMDLVEKMGKILIGENSLSVMTCDRILEDNL